ncbi:MAG: hypothetical protein WCK11_03665 [Candidatus Falkowbacteria bacterium]
MQHNFLVYSLWIIFSTAIVLAPLTLSNDNRKNFVKQNFALAAATPQFQQTITAGTLLTDIRDNSRVTVASPTVAMSAINASFGCASTTGTFGSSTQRIYVDNPSAANNGWTLSLAATGGVTSLWTSASSTFDFNDPTTSGCADGGDADTKIGDMTLNPTVGTITADYTTGSSIVGISKGAQASFNEGTVNSITIMSAANTASSTWRGYMTGIGVVQTIPAEQQAQAYTLGMTLTVVAN